MYFLYLHSSFEKTQYDIMQTAVKLGAPAVVIISKAKAGIRTHVFDAEEYRLSTSYQKVRSKTPDLFLFSDY